MDTKRFTITETDEAVLRALARYHYLTAKQLSRLLYPNLHDEDRYAQRRLKRLADANYALLLNDLPPPKRGLAPYVYTLRQQGRQYLRARGVRVQPYYRPSEEKEAALREHNAFLPHRLAAIDVMIAADCLCRDHQVTCPRMLSERDLKHMALRVDVPPGLRAVTQTTRSVAVIPDAWFDLSVGGSLPFSIALELDRGTEDQFVWRQKVAALAYWAVGPCLEAFETNNLTIAVVCPDPTRRDVLREWTHRELTERGFDDILDIFLFTAASPVATAPRSFFCDPHWHSPKLDVPVALLDAPPEPAPKEVPIFVQ